MDLALIVTAAAAEAEIEGHGFGKLELPLLKRLFDRQKFAFRGQGFIPGGTVDRTAGHAGSALGAGKDILCDPFKLLRHERSPKPQRLGGEKGKKLEHEPLGSGEAEVKEVRLKKGLLKGTPASRGIEEFPRVENS